MNQRNDLKRQPSYTLPIILKPLGRSLWDQLENRVQREIRNALSEKMLADISATFCKYKYMLDRFVKRGKLIPAIDRKEYIRDIKNHFEDTIGDYHKFDFTRYKGWALTVSVRVVNTVQNKTSQLLDYSNNLPGFRF